MMIRLTINGGNQCGKVAIIIVGIFFSGNNQYASGGNHYGYYKSKNKVIFTTKFNV